MQWRRWTGQSPAWGLQIPPSPHGPFLQKQGNPETHPPPLKNPPCAGPQGLPTFSVCAGPPPEGRLHALRSVIAALWGCLPHGRSLHVGTRCPHPNPPPCRLSRQWSALRNQYPSHDGPFPTCRMSFSRQENVDASVNSGYLRGLTPIWKKLFDTRGWRSKV